MSIFFRDKYWRLLLNFNGSNCALIGSLLLAGNGACTFHLNLQGILRTAFVFENGDYFTYHNNDERLLKNLIR